MRQGVTSKVDAVLLLKQFCFESETAYKYIPKGFKCSSAPDLWLRVQGALQCCSLVQCADTAGAFLLASTAISAFLGAAQCSLTVETFVTLRIQIKPPSLKKKKKQSGKARFNKVNSVYKAAGLHRVQLLQDCVAVSA